jgi:singapore isolate B (sub-type 7) whole genome shotgun sequence assembly, scaffold_5
MNLENNTVVTSEVKKVEREPEPATRHRTQSIDVQGPEISRVRSASIDMKEEKMLPPNPMAVIISFL